MKSLVLIFIIFSFFTISLSIDLNCDFGTIIYPTFGSFYYCKVQNSLNISTKLISTIISAVGVHSSEKTNDDVVSITADRKNIQYFPQGLQLVFGHLKEISILYGRIKMLTAEDLEPFTELLILNLTGNDIEILEDDIFASNLNLTQIHLNDNKLLAIDNDAFTKLTKLTHLNLQLNLCINKQANGNSTILAEVIRETITQCNPEDYLAVEQYLKKYEEKLICSNSETILLLDAKYEEIRGIMEGSNLSRSLRFNEKLQMVTKLKNSNIWTVKNRTDEFAALLMNHSTKIMTKLEIGDKALKDLLINLDITLGLTKDDLTDDVGRLEDKMNDKIGNIQEAIKNFTETHTESIRSLENLIMISELNLEDRIMREVNSLAENVSQEVAEIDSKLSIIQNNINSESGTIQSNINITIKNSEKLLIDKISNLEELLTLSTGLSTNKTQNTEKDLNTKISKLADALKKSDHDIKQQISSEVKILTQKIDNIERILRIYITSDTRAMWNFQSNVDNRLKVQNYKIDKSSQIQSLAQSVLIASCAFLMSLIIYVIYKKFLYRMMTIEEKREEVTKD